PWSAESNVRTQVLANPAHPTSPRHGSACGAIPEETRHRRCQHRYAETKGVRREPAATHPTPGQSRRIAHSDGHPETTYRSAVVTDPGPGRPSTQRTARRRPADHPHRTC